MFVFTPVHMHLFIGVHTRVHSLFSTRCQWIHLNSFLQPEQVINAIQCISCHSSQGISRVPNSLDLPLCVCTQLFGLAQPIHSGTSHTMSFHFCFSYIISQSSPGNQDSQIQILLCFRAYQLISLPLNVPSWFYGISSII